MAIFSELNGVDCRYCTSQMKKVRGCVDPKDAPARIGKFETLICPRRYFSGKVSSWLEAYGFYKNGHFPTNEGWLYLSAKLLQVFNVIDGIVKDLTKKE